MRIVRGVMHGGVLLLLPVLSPILLPVRRAVAHPVHVSSTQIALSADGKRFAITVRIFTDDLEEALKRAGTPVSLTRGTTAAVDSALSAYLGARFRIAVDGAPPVRGRLIRHEHEDAATLSILEVPLRAAPNAVMIDQQVMFELFDDQTNLLHLSTGTSTRSAMLRRGSARASFTL